jgi:phosphatidylglycerophosphate synthase
MYFASVSLMFLSLLYAAHLERRQLVIQLSLASAVFHSIEYMAIVMWSSTTPKYRERHDVMGNLARSWLSFLTFFILFLGVTNYLIAEGYEETWILINLIVAFLHYAFDGMIWKSRKKKRAEGQHV